MLNLFVYSEKNVVFVDTSALIGGLLSVFIILVIALLAVMWYRRHPVLVNTYCPKWTSNWGRSSNGQDSPSRSFANNMFNQEITMSTLEVCCHYIFCVCCLQHVLPVGNYEPLNTFYCFIKTGYHQRFLYWNMQ